MGTFNILQTPIFVETIKGYQRTIVDNELWNAYNNVEAEKNMQHAKDVNKASSSASLSNFADNLLHQDGLSETCGILKKYITQHISEIAGRKLAGNDYDFVASWFTSTKNKQFIPPHTHRGKDMSGVYYLQTNGKDGNLNLYNPITALDTTYYIKNKKDVSIIPEEGQLILFPSWLLHGTVTNETQSNRISFSFDILFERKENYDEN